MKNLIQVYNGTQITFRNGNNVLVNLTSVSKAFPEKNLTQIINSQEIKDYCHALAKLQNYSLTDLLVIRRGGINAGTWAHQKVALRVAQKLSPEFAVWVDTKIEEILLNNNKQNQEKKNTISLSSYNFQVEMAQYWKQEYRRCSEHLAVSSKHLSSMVELLKDSYDKLYFNNKAEKAIEPPKPITPRQRYYTVVGYASLTRKRIDRTQASVIGRRASAECRRQNIEAGYAESAMLGTVRTYPREILKEVFTEYFR